MASVRAGPSSSNWPISLRCKSNGVDVNSSIKHFDASDGLSDESTMKGVSPPFAARAIKIMPWTNVVLRFSTAETNQNLLPLRDEPLSTGTISRNQMPGPVCCLSDPYQHGKTLCKIHHLF